MAKLIFINLPVSDPARATAFYQAIGAVKREPFCDDTASCMVFSDTIHVMLMTHDKYRQFTTKTIADMGHVIGGVRETYDRYEYLDEKRDALVKLSNLLREIIDQPELQLESVAA